MRERPEFSDTVAHRCRVLVRQIGNASELRELWEEAEDDFDAWFATLEDLDARLGGG